MSKKESVIELNGLLRNTKLDLPSFRCEVTKSGKNVAWLVKHIGDRNSGYNPRIDELLAKLNSE